MSAKKSYINRRHWFKAVRHWPVQFYLFLLIFLTWIPECVNALINKPEWQIWLLSIFAIIGFVFMLLLGFSIGKDSILRVVVIVSYLLAVGMCIYFRFFASATISMDWLYISLLLSSLSYMLYPPVFHRKASPSLRFFLLFCSIGSFAAAIWFAMIPIHRMVLYSWLFSGWNDVWNAAVKGLKGIATVTFDWMPSGLTLMTGCMLILSWSQNVIHDEWNPYRSHELEPPQRKAIIALGILAVVVFSRIAGYQRSAFIGFFLLLAIDMTIMIYCHAMQTEEHVRSLVSDHIIYQPPFFLYPSTPSNIYHKISRVSQHIMESKKLNTAHEKGRKTILLLREIENRSEKIIRKAPNDEIKDWAFAIGIGSIPEVLPDDCTIVTMKTYFYDVFEYTYHQLIEPTDHFFEVYSEYGKYILYGMLMGAVRLCAQSKDWYEEFEYGNKTGTEYSLCKQRICPNEDMKFYHTCMIRAVFPETIITDRSQTISLIETHTDERRRTELSNIFYPDA